MNIMRPEDSAGKSQRPEAFGPLLFGVPGIDAGEVYVLPAERRDVLEQLVSNVPAVLAQMRGGTAEINGVPMHDGADDEVEAGGAECLTVKGAIPDLTALMEQDGPA